MIQVLFDPVDTLFFRDGTPFSSGSASQADVGGMFPPPPPSLTGAIRAALGRANGWDGLGRWDSDMAAVLGDGPTEMGKLSVAGPFVVRGGEVLYPAPRHLVGMVRNGSWVPVGFSTPGNEPLLCDLGEVRLPVMPMAEGEERPKPASGLWLTSNGLSTVARGALPSPGDLVPEKELWTAERRVGIARDRTTRTVEQGKLFSTIHVRLRRGVAVGALVEGVPPDWQVPDGEAVLLGGETRLATWRRWEPVTAEGPPAADIEAAGRVALLAVTPLDAGEGLEPGCGVPGLEGLRLVSACCDRPFPIGGWDSLERAPLPLHGVLPAGSVLFCEAGQSDLLSWLPAGANPYLRAGCRTSQGFGVLFPMTWPKEGEKNR